MKEKLRLFNRIVFYEDKRLRCGSLGNYKTKFNQTTPKNIIILGKLTQVSYSNSSTFWNPCIWYKVHHSQQIVPIISQM